MLVGSVYRSGRKHAFSLTIVSESTQVNSSSLEPSWTFLTGYCAVVSSYEGVAGQVTLLQAS